MGYRVPDDALVVDALRAVLAEHAEVESQARLGELVRDWLVQRDAAFTVSDPRVRRLALAHDLAQLVITTGTTDRPAPEACPASGADRAPVHNRTLDGERTVVGTRCPACPYRSGPTHEVPLRYGFIARGLPDGVRKGPF